MIPLVSIVGPTAVGKSSLALELAEAQGGEIINADSRQVYRYMDIATAKPTPEERALVPHHLVDVVNPDQDFNLAVYQSRAQETIADIRARGKLPILVGGSGLYVWSVIEGWRIPPVPPDPGLRLELEAKAMTNGIGTLYQELSQLDPAAAQRIDPRNIRRVIRALEVSRQGRPFSQLQGKEPAAGSVTIGLTAERARLYGLIDARVDSMMHQGMLEEVRQLVARGYGFDLPSMSGLGYRQLGRFLQGEIDLATAVQQIKYDTHRFARHQYSWFRLGDRRIRWFDTEAPMRQAVTSLIEGFRGSQGHPEATE
jgi:tRNA dimethylallyltransferase